MDERANHSLPACSLGFGQTIHRRLRGTNHRFVYRSFFLEMDVTNLNNESVAGNWLFGVNRAAALSFRTTDHGTAAAPYHWLCALLKEQGLAAPAKVRFRGFTRVFGYAFKPVSFWFCEDINKHCYAVVAEVNNTFGERHCYLLHAAGQIVNGQKLTAPKQFHVSPFCDVDGRYEFRFAQSANRSVVRIDFHDDEGVLLQTSLSGKHEVLSNRTILRALINYPLFTVGVIARIHWQAFQLWRRGLPFFRKPKPPAHFVTTADPS